MSFEAIILQGIDLPRRRLSLHGDIDEGTAGPLLRSLLFLSDDGDGEPVELYITSCGGDLDEAFGLHDAMRTCPIPVHTLAIGKCYSAAPLLLAAGTKGQRSATENTRFMLHDAWTDGIGGTISSVAGFAEITKRQMDTYARLLARYTDRPAEHWRKLMTDRDHYFDTEQALEWGLIDFSWRDTNT